MKTRTTCRRTLKVAAIFISLAVSYANTRAAEYSWRAEWGIFPDQVDSTMVLFNFPTNRPVPVLTNGALVFRTFTRNLSSGDGLEDYQIYDQAPPNAVMPTQLVIEAEVLLESGISTVPGRPPAYVVWIGAPAVLGLFGIDVGHIYLGRNQSNHWATANVPTGDTFHHYRIEVDSPTVAGLSANQVRVYRDFNSVPILQGPNGGDGANATGGFPEIFWGDGTDWAFGVSRWKSFRHNAALKPSRPMMFIHSSPDEVRWTSHSNVLYNLQFTTNLTPSAWMNIATNVTGSGTTNSFTDTLRSLTAEGYYRVQMLP